MNQLHEWLLRFLSRREREGKRTTARDLFAASTSVTHVEVLELVEAGLVGLEQDKGAAAGGRDLGAETMIVLTEKGRQWALKRTLVR